MTIIIKSYSSKCQQKIETKIWTGCRVLTVRSHYNTLQVMIFPCFVTIFGDTNPHVSMSATLDEGLKAISVAKLNVVLVKTIQYQQFSAFLKIFYLCNSIFLFLRPSWLLYCDKSRGIFSIDLNIK